ncbi:MAG TPA: protoglobin domain-containing protein [Planctomycetota bacterium]|nr:protoglobin domain-containing protein [Planctomycetota bacterium]
MQEEHILDELKRYVGFGAADEACLRALGPRLAPRFPRIAEDFYDHILAHPGARAAITGGSAQVERLKGTLRDWMALCFAGPWDLAYFEKRARIGRKHVEIRLPQQYMFTAVNVIRGHFVDGILDTAAGLAEARAEIHALDRLLDIELAVMLHTFREDYASQVQRSERLATFGQLVASIGHELRNPLGVMESSLFIARDRAPQDEKLRKHLDRIGEQIRVSNKIITDFLDLIRERPRKPAPAAPRDLVDAAAASIAWPAHVQWTVEVPPDLPRVEVDGDQVRQILTNLLSNAADAAGEVRVTGRAEDGHVALVVSDSGPGIAPSVRARLFEPLVTTKAKGTGLGLALCRRLAQANGGSIRVLDAGAGPLPGAAFEVRLPAARGGAS